MLIEDVQFSTDHAKRLTMPKQEKRDMRNLKQDNTFRTHKFLRDRMLPTFLQETADLFGVTDEPPRTNEEISSSQLVTSSQRIWRSLRSLLKYPLQSLQLGYLLRLISVTTSLTIVTTRGIRMARARRQKRIQYAKSLPVSLSMTSTDEVEDSSTDARWGVYTGEP